MSPIHSSATRSEQTSPMFYPHASDPATLGCLESLLKDKIKTQGAMSFYDWMQECLYHPELGYYCSGQSRVGKDGDFFTSVTVGSLFGKLLARRITELANETNLAIHILELGANTGTLANDILNALREDAPELYDQLTYTICEPLASMQQIQRETLRAHSSNVTFTNWNQLAHLKGYTIFLNNELIDAFPVRLLEKSGSQWLEKCINMMADGSFGWELRPIACPEAIHFSKNLGFSYPDGYQCEFRPGLNSFTMALGDVIQSGCVISIDYGYTQSELYASHRKNGTLRTFYQHQAGENPLENPGCLDITAHVDFTQWARCLQNIKFEPTYFGSQSSYLTQLAGPLFKALESQGASLDTKMIRQFQTLTHPSMLGAKFYALEAHKNAQPDRAVQQRLELA